jgi:uncharacterized protein (TIGR00645 family)
MIKHVAQTGRRPLEGGRFDEGAGPPPKRSSIQSIEDAFEAGIFWSRWILAPAYIVLVVCLMVLSYKTAEELFQLLTNLRIFDEGRTILQVLTIVDLVLVLNLVLMILFVGYTNFVSKIDPERTEDRPRWMDYLDYSGLKVQLVGSIIAIASITLLRAFIELNDLKEIEPAKLTWMVILYCAFLIAVLIIAIVNKLKSSVEAAEASSHREEHSGTE